MVSESVFDAAKDYIRELFEGDGSGHDYLHSVRVHDAAVTIQASEGGDLDAIRLASLLHDVDDRKLFDSRDYDNARRFMNANGIPEDMQESVIHIISQISFKGKDSVTPDTLEGKIVQDCRPSRRHRRHRDRPGVRIRGQQVPPDACARRGIPGGYGCGNLLQSREHDDQPLLREAPSAEGYDEHLFGEGAGRGKAQVHGGVSRGVLCGMGRSAPTSSNVFEKPNIVTSVIMLFDDV